MGVRKAWKAIGSAVVLTAAVVAVAIAPAGAAPAPITLGSTTGTPSMNIASCALDIACTFVPFNSLGAPSLAVPADGTIKSVSENFPPAVTTVQLRVLRPAGGGRFTGAGTSAPLTSTAAGGVQSFAVNLPVKAGDVIGLDNSQSRLLFDSTTDPLHAIVGYYIPTRLADGTTAVPDRNQTGYRLPLSVVEQPTGTTTSTSTTTTVTVTRTVTGSGHAPSLSSVRQSASRWRERGRAQRHHPPIGTTFSFRLRTAATVTITFFAGAHAKGRLVVHGRTGTNRVAFRGRVPRLRTGSYLAVLVASDSAGRASAPSALAFTIVK